MQTICNKSNMFYICIYRYIHLYTYKSMNIFSQNAKPPRYAYINKYMTIYICIQTFVHKCVHFWSSNEVLSWRKYVALWRWCKCKSCKRERMTVHMAQRRCMKLYEHQCSYIYIHRTFVVLGKKKQVVLEEDLLVEVLQAKANDIAHGTLIYTKYA